MLRKLYDWVFEQARKPMLEIVEKRLALSFVIGLVVVVGGFLLLKVL